MKKIYALILFLVVCVWLPMSFAQQDISAVEGNVKEISEQEEDQTQQVVEERRHEVETKEIEKVTKDEQSMKNVVVQFQKLKRNLEEIAENPSEGINDSEEIIDEPQKNENVDEDQIEDDPVIYEIVFVTDSFEEKITVANKSILEKPQNPIKEGYQFISWLDQETKKAFDFSQEIVSKHTLIASFEEIPVTRVLSDKGVRVKGSFLEEENLSVVVSKQQKGGWIYSLMIVDANGEEIPLRGDTLVSINLQDGIEAEDMQLQYENESYPATMSGSTISFTTDHFSDWSVLPKKVRIETQMIYPIKKYYGARKLKANTYPNNLGVDDWWWMDQINKFYVNGETAFCVQPGGSISNRNAEFISANDYIAQNIGGQAVFDLVKTNRIIYYGWEQSNQTNLDYLVTQLMVWEDGIGNVVEYKDFTFDGLSLEEYKNRREEILDKVSKHARLPSFHNDTVDLEVGESITLTDENEVLDQFEDFSANGLEFKRNGNQLTVTLLSEDGKKQSVIAEKKSNSYIGTPVISTDSEQDVIVYRLQNSLSTILNVGGSDLYGNVGVAKRGPNNEKIQGAVFAIYKGDTKLQQKMTGKDGDLIFYDILRGDYYVKEISVPEPYELDETKHPVTVYGGHYASVIVVNDIAKAKIELVKTEKDTQIPIEGAEFDLRNEQGNLIEHLITNEQGVAVASDLEFGEYTITETKVPSGYLIDLTPIQVFADSSQKKVISIENEKVMGRLIIKKKDLDRDSLAVANVKYLVRNEAGEEVDAMLTNQEGIAKSKDLPLGKYTIEEVQAPLGYVLDEQIYPVEFLYQDDQTKYVEMEKVLLNKVIQSEIHIFKYNKQNKNQPVAGAVFEVLDEKNQPALDVTGKEVGKIVTDQEGFAKTPLLRHGIYHVVEVQAPEQYYINDEIFVAKIQELDKPAVIEISDEPVEASFEIIKKDADTKKMLAGSVFQILDEENQIVMDSIKVGKDGKFKSDQKLPYGKYILREIEAPGGYLLAEDLQFEVSKESLKESTHLELEVDNEATYVEISKQSMGGEEVVGAKLQVFDAAGNLIEEWTSTTETHMIKGLVPGKYVLHEDLVPIGYRYAQNLDFEVLKKGGVQSFVMIDQPTEVTIKKVDEQGDFLPGATLQIVKRDGKMVKEWLSTTQPVVFKNLEAGEYILREIKAPYGYLVAKDQIFVVSNTGLSEDVTMINQKIKEKKVLKLQDKEKLPNTGSKQMYGFWMIAGILFLLSKKIFAQIMTKL